MGARGTLLRRSMGGIGQNIAAGGTNPPPITANLKGYWDIVDSVFLEADASGRVSSWSDLGSGNNPFIQATALNQPVLVGKNTAAGYVEGNGTNQRLRIASLTFTQPFTWYLVVNQVTWTINEPVLGNAAGSVGFAQNTASPQLVLYAGAPLGNTQLAVGAWGLVTGVHNGASSVFRVNKNTATTGAGGATNPSDLSLFSYAATFGNFQVKAVLCYDGIAHDSTQRDQIADWANSKFSLGY